MPLRVAEYLRHLSTRCTRLARDCYDPAVTKELEIISIELVEKAQNLETLYSISGESGEADVLRRDSVISSGDGGESGA
jgi:hypothetical protein